MGLRSLYLGVHEFDVGFCMFYMCIVWFTHGLHRNSAIYMRITEELYDLHWFNRDCMIYILFTCELYDLHMIYVGMV